MAARTFGAMLPSPKVPASSRRCASLTESVRNARRDANKRVEGDRDLPEDQTKRLKDEIQELLKQHEAEIDKLLKTKTAEILEE